VRKTGKVSDEKQLPESRYNHFTKAEAVAFEQVSQGEMQSARTQLAVEKVAFDNKMVIADIEAKMNSQMREAELQRELEIRRGALLEETHRAEKLSKAVVEAETIRTNADAAMYKLKAEADARLYEQEMAAKATEKMYAAQADGVRQLEESFSGDSKAILKYLFIESGAYVTLAKKNAEAISNLKPEISMWGTGSKK
jgi:flotillin